MILVYTKGLGTDAILQKLVKYGTIYLVPVPLTICYEYRTRISIWQRFATYVLPPLVFRPRKHRNGCSQDYEIRTPSVRRVAGCTERTEQNTRHDEERSVKLPLSGGRKDTCEPNQERTEPEPEMKPDRSHDGGSVFIDLTLTHVLALVSK